MEENNNSQVNVQAPVQQPPEPVSETPKIKILSKKWLVLCLVVLVLIVVGASAGYFFLNSNKQVACTQEAKLCPDGSSVGRTGPKCEFPACPKNTPTPTSSPTDTLTWKTYTNQEIGISFDYPSNWEPINKSEELCLPSGGSSRIVNNNPCVGIYLSNSLVPYKWSFLSTQSKIFPKFIPGRGISWMDEFSMSNKLNNVSPEEFVNSLCKINNQYFCIKETNKNGVVFVKILKPRQYQDWDEVDEKVDEKEKVLFYYVLNANENFPIIILSNQALVDIMTLDESEKIFDMILTNFKFTQ